MDPRVVVSILLIPLLLPIIVDRIREARAHRAVDRALDQIDRRRGPPSS